MFVKKFKDSMKGIAIVDTKTKNLMKRIKPGEIAVIHHEDLDEIAARDLISARVKAVINTAPFMTGSYTSIGASILFHNRVPLYECRDPEMCSRTLDGMYIEIKNDLVSLPNGLNYRLFPVTIKEIEERWQQAQLNMNARLEQFIENTLTYAMKEKHAYIASLPSLPIRTRLTRKHVLIVVRGKHYREDLRAIRSYIEDYSPILIGVDGGADALLEEGWKPDLIVGDMDSVSDQALLCGAEIIVHAYPNGHAPARERLDGLQIPYHILPATGTSEDVAMLYSYEQGADWIVALGAHSSMIDFLEKGRKGMASTLLVRMKVGTKLMDAKGVSMLYQKRLRWKNFFLVSSAALFPVFATMAISPTIQDMWHLVWLQIKFYMM